MHEADLPDQMEQLQDFAQQFESLATHVRTLPVTPGSAALQQIGPLIPTVQDLVWKVVLRVSAFDGSEITAATIHQSTLDTLSATVGTASQASYELARTLAFNPLTAQNAARAGTVRRRRQEAAARPVMAEHLRKAAALLDRCAASCRNVAARLAPEPNRTASSATARKEDHRPLSPIQAEALATLVKGGATLDTRGTHPLSVHTPDNTRITMTTYQSLVGRGLIRVDASGPLYRKRDIAVSAEGHRALERHRATPKYVGPPEAPSPLVARRRN